MDSESKPAVHTGSKKWRIWSQITHGKEKGTLFWNGIGVHSQRLKTRLSNSQVVNCARAGKRELTGAGHRITSICSPL